MKTFKSISLSAGLVVLVVCLAAASTRAQSTNIPDWEPFERTTYRDLQDRGIDVATANDYHHIVDAIGNSAWWNSLSHDAQSAIRQKIRSMGDRYTYDDLCEIMSFSTQDRAVLPLPEMENRSACPAGDVILTTQDEVDAYGAMSCTEVTGNLTINDACCAPKITDLSSLSSLTSVSGILKVSASQLPSLAGLTNITSVAYLQVEDCDALTNLDGLSGLTACSGPVLEPCSCSDFQNRIDNNDNLAEVDGLANLTSVASGMFIRNNPALNNIDGLSALSNIGGALGIEVNQSLQQVHGLSSLSTVGRDLVIRSNPGLANLQGLNNIGTVGSWTIIDNNDGLKNMAGLSGLNSIAGRFLIVNNDQLKNLDGASSLSHVGEIVWVENNAVIKNLEGMSSLTSAGGVYVYFNPLIKNINGLEGLTSVGANGIDITSNASLKDISGMSNVTSAGRLVFENLPELKNVDAASNVTWVDIDCGVVSCPLITNIEGFSNITYVGVALGVIDMASLENLDGLRNITRVGPAGVFVIGNPSLVSCCGIYQLLCTDPPSCTANAIDGDIVIFGNPSACSSPAEIIASGPCADPQAALQLPGSVPTVASEEQEIQVFPNPAIDRVTIKLGRMHESPVSIRMLDNLGNVVRTYTVQDPASERNVVFDISDEMLNGLYYLRFENADQIFARPLVVIR